MAEGGKKVEKGYCVCVCVYVLCLYMYLSVCLSHFQVSIPTCYFDVDQSCHSDVELSIVH